MAAAEAQRYAIVAVGTADLRCAWVEIWRMPGRAAAIDLARDLLDGGYARAVVVQGRGTPRSPTPVGETQVYVAVAAGYRVDAFFPTIPATHVEVRVSVPAHWRALLIAVPRDRAVHPRELVGQVTWRRSYNQMCHALRRMRDDGLLISPVRGHFQRAPAPNPTTPSSATA